MVPVLVLLFVAFWFILRGDLFYVLPCVILFLCFSVLLALLILVLFVRLFDLCLFGFIGFLFLLVSGKGCGLWLWHSLEFSLTFFWIYLKWLSWMPRYCRLCDVTQPQSNMQNQINKGFQESFCYIIFLIF